MFSILVNALYIIVVFITCFSDMNTNLHKVSPIPKQDHHSTHIIATTYSTLREMLHSHAKRISSHPILIPTLQAHFLQLI